MLNIYYSYNKKLDNKIMEMLVIISRVGIHRELMVASNELQWSPLIRRGYDPRLLQRMPETTDGTKPYARIPYFFL